MRGYITCKHCKDIGKTYKWWIFPKNAHTVTDLAIFG